jgi:hypothetical protein
MPFYEWLKVGNQSIWKKFTGVRKILGIEGVGKCSLSQPPASAPRTCTIIFEMVINFIDMLIR